MEEGKRDSPGKPKKAAAAAKLYTSSEVMPISEIMEALGIGSKATLYRYLRYAGVEINSTNNI